MSLKDRAAAAKAPRALSFDQLGELKLDAWTFVLTDNGYFPDTSVVYALQQMFRRRSRPNMTGVQALLLEGAPGVGKTALAEAIARITQAPFLVMQCHAWTDSDELFQGVNVPAAVAGDHANVVEPGILLRAARGSKESPVILLLDEIDKAPERVEALLLDFFQSGRVPTAPGKHVLANLQNLIVFITSNDQRTLTDAFQRRVRRLVVPPLPVATQVEILRRVTKLDPIALRAIVDAGARLAAIDQQHMSLQEAKNLAWEVEDTQRYIRDYAALARKMGVQAPPPDETERGRLVGLALAGWGARGAAGRAAAVAEGNVLAADLTQIGFFRAAW